MEEEDHQEQTNGGAKESTQDIYDLLDSVFDKKPQDVIDRIIELLFRYIEPSIPLLYGDMRKAVQHVIACKDIYSTLCSLFISRSLLSLAKEQTRLAEQQTKIAERQEAIAKGIKTSVDESTDVAKEVRELIVTIKRLTWAMLVLTGIAVIAAIASNWK